MEHVQKLQPDSFICVVFARVHAQWHLKEFKNAVLVPFNLTRKVTSITVFILCVWTTYFLNSCRPPPAEIVNLFAYFLKRFPTFLELTFFHASSYFTWAYSKELLVA